MFRIPRIGSSARCNTAFVLRARAVNLGSSDVGVPSSLAPSEAACLPPICDRLERSSVVHLTLRAARAAFRTAHRDLVFNRALARFARSPAKVLENDTALLNDLVYGWGNEGWSAHQDYLTACIDAALRTDGAILECGSGLTTLLVGIVAEQRGLSLWSLEHLEPWAERVNACLEPLRIEAAHIHVAPLRGYGDFDWYSPPLEAMPGRFSLVLCDGPPAATRGGRYGLASVMRNRLIGGCVILVDDAARDSEQAMVRRWASELPCLVAMRGDERQYFEVRLQAAHAGN